MRCAPWRALISACGTGLLLLASCNYFSEMASPTEYSTIEFSGKVLDSATAAPVPNVRITIETTTLETDQNGSFVFSDLTTGKKKAVVEKNGYFSIIDSVNVSFRTTKKYFYLVKNTPPIIDTFFIVIPSPFYIGDTALFVFRASDSTDQLLYAALDFGDTAVSFPYLVARGLDTISHAFQTAGPFDASLYLSDISGDSDMALAAATVINNHRPHVVNQTGNAPFFATYISRLHLDLFDADSNWKLVFIDWGDGSYDRIYELTRAAYVDTIFSHVYADTGLYPLIIRAFDMNNALAEILGSVEVIHPLPPQVAELFVMPDLIVNNQPESLSVNIVVIRANYYVSNIIWRFNYAYNPDSARTFSTTYDSLSGRVVSAGTTFSLTLPVVLFQPDTNDVSVWVTDAAHIRSGLKSATFVKQ